MLNDNDNDIIVLHMCVRVKFIDLRPRGILRRDPVTLLMFE